MLNKILLLFLFSFILISTKANAKFIYTCFGDSRDRHSIEFIKDTYNSSPIVGTFEVVEIGSQSEDSLAVGGISIVIKFRPIEILRGYKTKNHLHHMSTFGGGTGNRFKVGEKYLLAFKHLNTDGSSKDDSCDRAFSVPLKEANSYLEKFKKLKKSSK